MRAGRRGLIILGSVALAFGIASLPMVPLIPDAFAGNEALIRIPESGAWQIWHGSTRNTRELIGDVPEPLMLRAEFGGIVEQVMVRQSLTLLREEFGARFPRAVQTLRVEIFPDAPFLRLVSIAEAAQAEGIDRLTLSANARHQSVPVRAVLDPARPSHAGPALLHVAPGRALDQFILDVCRVDLTVPGNARQALGEDRRALWLTGVDASLRMFVGPRLLRWRSGVDTRGVPGGDLGPVLDVLADPDQGSRDRRRVSNVYVDVHDGGVTCAGALHVLEVIARDQDLLPELLVAGVDWAAAAE